MRIGVLGINHKLADLKLREALARACQRRFSPLSFSAYAEPVVLLSTCNRTEMYFSSPQLAEVHSFLLGILREEVGQNVEQKLYSLFGSDCFLHLARVTSGLDSAILAETEIQGQVKQAYEQAQTCLSLPHDLHYLFQKALRVGKSVRSTLALKRGMPDVEHVVFSTGSFFFKETVLPRILFVGASEINLKALNFLKHKRAGTITICNRTAATSVEWAERFGIETLAWEHLHEWPSFDWIICGTKAHEPVIRQVTGDISSRKLIMDLSVPRNVTPSLGRCPEITLINMDQLNRSLKIKRRSFIDNIAHAELQLQEEARKYMCLFQNKRLVQVS